MGLAAAKLGVQTSRESGREAKQRMQGVALGPGWIRTLPSRRVGADVGRIEVERDQIAARDPEQLEGSQVHRSQRLVELADVSQSEAPEERSSGLWCRDREAPQLFLSMIGARYREVVETRRPERDRLCHGEDRLGFGESPGPFLEV
jgi:hypothetical protein